MCADPQALSVPSGGLAVPGLTLVQEGTPRARIVLPTHPTPAERAAALELQRYVQQISGATLPLSTDRNPEGGNVLLGATASGAGLDLSEAALGLDGYVVQTSGRDLLLTGRQPYSTLYAVYHLLERSLGCGFFEDGDQVPQRGTVAVGELAEVEKPRWEWRMYVPCMTDAYSGVRWWDWEQFRQLVDWMVKRRLNVLTTERMADSCGVTALAARKLGVEIALTPWQQQRIALLRRVFAYARERGIRIVFNTGELFAGIGMGVPGAYPYVDAKQRDEFLRRYEEQTGEKVPLYAYEWCGDQRYVPDPRHPLTRQFVTAVVQAYTEAFGTDHLYWLHLPSEGGWAESDMEEMNRVTYAMVGEMRAAILAGDPQAECISPAPYMFGDTFEAQKRAVRDAGLRVYGDPWLNQPSRLHDFLMCDYYWGLPWSTGMTGQCGPHTNPNMDLALAIRNARELAADPRAAHCDGFAVRTETSHRNVMLREAFTDLAWDPAKVGPEDYLWRYTVRRYGPDQAARLQPATEAIARTLLSCDNMELTNMPLYRDWGEGHLPGLTATSAKRALSYLPELRGALETLLSGYEPLGDSPLYRFDLVDYGRTYLSALFNYRLARARRAGRDGDRVAFERAAVEVEELMRFVARYVSSHEQFRLQIHDQWAARWPEIVPGHPNAQTNWVTFTALISSENLMILDYLAEDFAELVVGYFWPRVSLYLQKLRELLQEGKRLSGSLGGISNRVSEWAPPVGEVPWSPYGPTCEPELKAGDVDLAADLIRAGSLSGQYDFYEGPLDALVRELLDRFPVPEDLAAVLAEPEPAAEALQIDLLEGKPGDTRRGFRTPGPVEQAVVPRELGYLVTVTQLSRQYNIMRGDIASYTVHANDSLHLTRLPHELAPTGDHQVAVFGFEAAGKQWRLHYDGGSQFSPAGVRIEPAQTP